MYAAKNIAQAMSFGRSQNGGAGQPGTRFTHRHKGKKTANAVERAARFSKMCLMGAPWMFVLQTAGFGYAAIARL
jgi:hypothetical protein